MGGMLKGMGCCPVGGSEQRLPYRAHVLWQGE